MIREELLRLLPTELIEIIMQLQERVALLEAQVASLAKPPKTSRNSSVPPSKSEYTNDRSGLMDKPNRKLREGAKPRGPKPGHVGHSRTRQTPDVVIKCRPSVCVQCGHDLTQGDQTAIGKSQVVDIPPIEPIVVEAHRFCATCPSCGHTQAADYPAGLEPERVFGPQVETLATYFHHVHHLSYERCLVGLTPPALRDPEKRDIPKVLVKPTKRLAQVLEEVFGLKIFVLL
jgi:hypothetical protein